jgi:GNAT superfamily N-acetyltransferase
MQQSQPVPASKICIRKAILEDVAGIVNVHLVSFHNFFLTFLGKRFLALLYREILAEPESIALVAVTEDGAIQGFAVGVRDQTNLYARLATRRCLLFAATSVHAVLKRPQILPRLFRAFKYVANSKKAACPALLMSIAVVPAYEHNHVGHELLERYIYESIRLGVDEVCLTTDRDKNERGNSFYQHHGFKVVRVLRTPEGRWLNEYVIKTRRRNNE